MGKLPITCAWCFYVLSRELGQGVEKDIPLTYDNFKKKLLRFESKPSHEVYAVFENSQRGQEDASPSPEPQDEDKGPSATTLDLEAPLFISFTASSPQSPRQLRGCKGTFQAARLDSSIEEFTIQAAFHDRRFRPITAAELPDLTCSVTLLHSFEACNDLLDWEVGKHGIRIRFVEGDGEVRRATFLPHVMVQQGWTQKKAIVQAIMKSGSTALEPRERRVPGCWRVVEKLGVQVTRYQGSKTSLSYAEWKAFCDWSEGDRRKRHCPGTEHNQLPGQA